MKEVLVLNTGSSSVKFAVYQTDKNHIDRQVLDGTVDKQGSHTVLTYKSKNKNHKINYPSNYSVKTAWKYINNLLADFDIKYIGFRVVHGGEEFAKATKINNQVLKKIAAYNKLAPLHNPYAVELIKAVRKTMPRVKMAATFDTAWYQYMRPEHYLYSIPQKFYKQHGIRKYGFHGLSHQLAVNFTANKIKKDPKKLSIISCHLGAGASITWFEQGRVMDTTMGFDPNEGMTMGTRSGDIPAGVVLHMISKLKMSVDQISNLLNKQSGILGLMGYGDFRDLLIANNYKVKGYNVKRRFSKAQKQNAKLALKIFVYDAKKYVSSFAGMSESLDAIVFTGAVGYHSAVMRKLITQGINLPNKTKIIAMPNMEMINIAKQTIKCLN